MTSSTRTSPPLALLGLLALLGALLALAVAGASTAQANRSAEKPRKAVSASELAFRNDMRKLWEDHIIWTRQVIVSFAAGLPDLDPALQRLLGNQADIGDAVKPFYGEAAGDQLTALLREHILIAADVLAAAKAGDGPALAAAQERWYANGNDIAAFLSAANPKNWPLGELQAMLRAHIDLTTAEAVARLTGDWEADIAAFDEIHLQALEMADVLSTGIVRQFPKRFRR
ncbi:MAG: glycosyltransferase [Gaiellaceae bacterium]